MALLDQIVDIQITKDTATLTRVGFGLPAILTYNTAQTELAKSYGSLEEMLVAPGGTGPFAATSREVAMATAIFSQNPKPSSVIVLRRATAPTRTVVVTPITDATAGKPFNSYDYSITLGDGVDEETFTFTTDATATVAEITAGLETLINAGTVNVLATDGTTDLTIEKAVTPGGAATAGVPFTMEIDRNLMTQAESTADPGIAADLAAAQLVNDDWYCLMSDATSPAEITALAGAVETQFKLYLADSQDDDVIASGSGDIASTLQTAARERTALQSHPFPGSSAYSSAWAGKQLPTDSGSTTWKFKTLSGVLAQGYGSAEITQMQGKKANFYTSVAGLNMTAEGTTSSGEFIDIVRGIDALRQRMKENVFRVLKVNPKIPFTKLGIQTIVNEVEGVLREFTGDGALLSPDVPFVVTFPDPSEVDANTKALRCLPDINFTATLSGAVHKVEIRGRVSV